VDALVEAIAGRLGRRRRGAGARRLREDPGGAPRAYRPLRRLDEIGDADPVDVLLFAQGRLPGAPRALRRERSSRTGSLVLARDVSASMEGSLGRWAAQVVSGLVARAAVRRARIGYIEFNHEAIRYRDGQAFLHRRYGALLARASRRRAEGRTSYQAPLAAALAELARAPEAERHLVLLTDGLPVVGDPEVARERALARRLGVQIHTVFIGLGQCPAVLERIARETRGLAFQARPLSGGRIRVALRCGSGPEARAWTS
jgi:uncharacterized protein with von Willebrand factor type A (vWA) domain